MILLLITVWCSFKVAGRVFQTFQFTWEGQFWVFQIIFRTEAGRKHIILI